MSKVAQAKTTLLESLAACEHVMPEHHAAALDLLSMVQTVTPDSFHQIRERGRRLWAKYQARSNDDVSLVLDFIVKSKHMWCNVRSVYDDSELITYPLAARIIGTWATQLTESVPFKLLLGAMLSELSLSLLGKILTVLNLESGGILGGRYLPVCVSSPPTPGQVGSGSVLISMLAHPAFSSALNPERQYVVTSVYENTAANWIVPRTQLTTQSNYIIKLKEVQS